MKKVGIITYHHYYNYGTVLQAYALQKAIESLGDYDSEIIDFRAHNEKKLSRVQLVMLRIRRMGVYIRERERVYRLKKYDSVFKEKRPFFDEFFDSSLKVSSQTFNSYPELKREKLDYDIYVTGSDQTWSPKIGLHPAMFLRFAPVSARKIAYAPSIGVASLQKTESDQINYYLQQYDAISCRESIGQKVLSDCVKGKEIVNVLDPTFLLTGNDWNILATTPGIKTPYILCYFIGDRPYYRVIAKQLSVALGLPLYFIPVSWRDVGEGNDLLPKTGPREFLGLIRDARLVLTDSFHGTAFAINYRKSFYSFTKIEGGNTASDNSRLYDILSKIGLEDRLYDSPGYIDFSDVDYSSASIKLEELRNKSIAFLQKALIDRRICPANECTDCTACSSICAHNAIQVRSDLMGFRYPQKDLTKCVNCGLCEKVCHNIYQPELRKPVNSYVATAIQESECLSSTSGGLASVLSKRIISQGGVVYGCTSEQATHIRHIRIDKEIDVLRLKGSKYVLSDMRGIMPQIKADLKNGLKVLFVGTPCQVAGVKTYLGRSYENLLTVDFVCHGVPSQQIFNDIVSSEYPMLKKEDLSVQFRIKDVSGKSRYGVRLSDSDGKEKYSEYYPSSRYIAGFLCGIYYRENCYQCHYARPERVSDITLGDFWDSDGRYAAMVGIAIKGFSMVMVNTEAGAAAFASIADRIVSRSINTEDLVRRNGQLSHPMVPNASKESFAKAYSNGGYNSKASSLVDTEIEKVKKSIKISHASKSIKSTAIGRELIRIIKKIK